jgi:pimeloyl-ACP methyl ester carboxylesterase
MPKIAINGRQLHYHDAGSGPETIIFSHGYLMDHRMFAAQIAALSQSYRVIAYDHRGHGQSDPCLKPFGLYDLVGDAAELIDALCDGPVHFAGMSTGGYVGMRLLLKRPKLIKSLILIDTSAGAEDPISLKQYDRLLFFVRLFGIPPILGKVLPLMMGQTFRTDPDRREDFNSWKAYIGRLNKTSVRHFGRAIFDRDDVLDDLRAVGSPPPTLIVVGAEDIPTPPSDAKAMHAAIVGSRFVQVPDAGHTSPVEQPEAVTDALTEFLRGLG